VVDRQGKAVAGVLVRQSGDGPVPTETRSDERGQFQLPGVLEGPVILLVEKSGFRSQPHALAQTDQPSTVAVRRSDEPSAVSYKTLPSALPADQEKALAHRLFEPFAKRVLKDGKEEDKRTTMTRMAEIDPAWTLDHLDAVKFDNPDELNEVRSNVVGALLRENPDEAGALIENISDSNTRARVYAGVARYLLKSDPARARRYLEEAILNNRATNQPRRRMSTSLPIIDLLIDVGDTERAREWLQANRQQLGPIFAGRSLNMALARTVLVPLARVDPAKALAELEDVRREAEKQDKTRADPFFDFHSGRIAFSLADRSPADAERLLRQMSNSPSVVLDTNTYALAICFRMATKDLPRALRLADMIAPGEIEMKAFAMGLMAEALAASDKPTALGLLDEAFRELEALRARGRISQFASVSGVAGGLLPIVEQVDADLLPEYLARAIALRPPQNEGKGLSLIPEQTAPLAMMVARCDRDLAARVIEPDLENLGRVSLSFAGTDLKTTRTLCAMTLIDPHKAVELIEAFPESPSTAINGFAPTKNDIVIEAARLLSLQGDDRWRHVYERYLLLWTPDQELR
jgi:hypothetical protein